METNQPASTEVFATPPKRKFRWLKRLSFALFVPIVLLFIGVFLLHLLGNNATHRIDAVLARIWLPATCFRLAIYALLAYVVAPFFIRQRLEVVQSDIIAMENLMSSENSAEMSEEKMTELTTYHRYAVAKATALSNYLQHRYWILTALLIFDALTIQLPFLLRG